MLKHSKFIITVIDNVKKKFVNGICEYDLVFTVIGCKLWSSLYLNDK